MKDELAGPLRVMQEAARRIAKISIESKLPIVEGTYPPRRSHMHLTDVHRSSEEYVASFKPELMDAVYSWCNGAKFSEICKVSPFLPLLPCETDTVEQMTDVFEGSLIRVFRRLQELIRQMAMAAKAIGSDELEKKFNDSLACLERQSSVAFAASLVSFFALSSAEVSVSDALLS